MSARPKPVPFRRPAEEPSERERRREQIRRLTIRETRGRAWEQDNAPAGRLGRWQPRGDR